MPRAGERKPAPDKGQLVPVPRGDPAQGSVPTVPSQPVLGAVRPHKMQDVDAPLLPLQIYPDPELEAQVLSLAIRCIHSEEGCRWSGLIKHLQVGPGRMRRGGKVVPRGLPVTIAVSPRPISAPVAST